MKSFLLAVALFASDAEAARKLSQAKSALHRRHLHHLRSLHLAVGADVGNIKCQCIGFDGVNGQTTALISNADGKDVTAPYPGDLGSSCKDWDAENHPLCKETSAKGWCKDKWCYVDPKDCHLPVMPKPSAYMPQANFQTLPIYYSYATCGGTDAYAKEVPQVGSSGCRCVGFEGSPGMTVAAIGDKKVEYPAEIGGDCKAWDAGHHPDCTGGDDQPDWCEKKWCFVDPCSCTAAVPPKVSAYLGDGTFKGKPIFWSYATCGAEDSFSAEGDLGKSKKIIAEVCNPEKKADEKVFGKAKCPCVGFDAIDGETIATVTHMGQKTEVSYPADLGGSCDQWEAESHPTCKGNSPPAWCKESWCYVDPRNCHLQILPKKAVYQPGALYQTLPLYYSYSTCGATDTWTVGAPDVGQQGCRCIGLDGMPGVMDVKIDGSTVQYPAEMGGTCQAWDAVNHPTCMGPDKADWCTKKWCYVDPCACNAAAPPKSAQFLGDATFQGRNVFWSYATCGETDTYSTPEHQASSKAEIERSCVASQAPPTAQGTVFSKRASTETDAKSGAHGLRTILAIMALCSSLLK